ncbi:MAG: T9SS type A sorting domain-containing protein [Bacteroidota bacterium]
MKNYFKITTFILIIASLSTPFYGQNCNNMNIQWKSDIASTCNFMIMTMMHDDLDRPYLYVANKEAGLKIYDISVITAPTLVATVSTNLFGSLDVTNVSQSGNYLFLSIGNTFTNPQQGGMAIIDITNPLLPTVTDHYLVPSSTSGGGIVKVEGDYAYLGAMKNGLVILDVSNKSNIQFVSQFVPNINYPPIANPNPDYYNARGMEVKNSIVYLCYDGGGFRIINCTNKLSPLETGRWCNPAVYTPMDHPKAYNNIILDGNLVYIAVDYCGMEILNISDTSNITLTGWWNPYNCPNNNWFNTPVHANEIQYNKDCKQIFLSTGKSDMMVVDVSNPALPDSCNFYGGVSNSLGTWGVGLYQNEIYLSYICAIVPFPSNWTGVKILTYTSCPLGIDESNDIEFSIYPNPAQNDIKIETSIYLNNVELTIYNSFGQVVKKISKLNGNSFTIENKELSNGLYFIVLANENKHITSKLIIDK